MKQDLIIPGEVITPGKVENGQCFIEVKNADKAGEILVIEEGLVVSICGGAGLELDDPICQEAAKLAQAIVDRGGVIVNGGEEAGTMLAVAKQVKDKLLGVACEYHPFNPYSKKAIIDHYQSRKMIITSVFNVVVFPGQIGTFDELVTTIGWIKSSLKQEKATPHLFAHKFWQPLWQLLGKKSIIQTQVKSFVTFFEDIEEIVDANKGIVKKIK